MTGSMPKSGMMQQSPNFNNNNIQMQMYQSQFATKHCPQSLPVMDSANNSAMFGKTVNQPMSGMLMRQQSTGQFSIAGSCANNSNAFQPPTPQPQQVF